MSLATAVLAAPSARAGEHGIEAAREARRDARRTAGRLVADLGPLSARYERVRARADAAAARLVDAWLRESALQGQVAAARALLEGRADALYRTGPGGLLEALLGSDSLGELVQRGVLLERSLEAGVEDAAEALDARREATRLRRQAERLREDLATRQAEMTRLRTVMEIRLAEALEAARRAGQQLAAYREQRRALAAAAALEQGFANLVDAGADQTELLAMLGPTGGRGCTIPPDLVSTGRTFSGEASFYGEEFAGNPTATGAIFDPTLFTAAHRTLPLPSFLHVRYGDRCATVLVNDRGPYVEGRVLDLSEGAARYLGLPGVGDVHAEILAPA